MYPELFTIGGFTVYTYGVCVAIGFFIAIQYVIVTARKINLSKNQIYDLFFYLIVFGILGARLFYIITEINYFIKNPIEIFQVWKGGLVYYGGFIISVIFGFCYLYKKNINIKKTFDIFAPAIALGHVFGRLGCFFSGCCYGKECNFFLSINNRYPTQLFEAFGNLIIFILLDKFNKSEHQDGQVFVLYLLCYSALRFFIEFLRGDDRGVFVLGLSVAQIISSCIFVIVVFIIILSKWKKNERNNL